MYLPSRFEVKNEKAILELIQNYPLATVISVVDEVPQISFLPLILQKRDEKIFLIGHLAKANPQWKALNQKPVTVVFNGPQTYITPKWYAENDVPTWNYTVVEIRGKAQLKNSYQELVSALELLSNEMEKNSSDPWEFWLPPDLTSPEDLQSAIVAFEIEVESLRAKFKLSQNRSVADQNGVIEGLSHRKDSGSLEIRKMMKGNCP